MLIGGAIGATIFVAIALYSFLHFVEWYKSEPIIPYTISVPNPSGDGKVLEKPSVKVSEA